MWYHFVHETISMGKKKEHSLSYRMGGWEHYRCGKIPGAYHTKTGIIIIPDEIKETLEEFIVTYARVSSSENKSNLERQSERLIQ
jgi:putative resolvase